MKRLEAIADMAWVLAPGVRQKDAVFKCWVQRQSDGKWQCYVSYGPKGCSYIEHVGDTPDEVVQATYDELVRVHEHVQSRSQSTLARWANKALRLIRSS